MQDTAFSVPLNFDFIVFGPCKLAPFFQEAFTLRPVAGYVTTVKIASSMQDRASASECSVFFSNFARKIPTIEPSSPSFPWENRVSPVWIGLPI